MPQPGEPAAFVVIAEFAARPDCIQAFLALAQDDASRSVAARFQEGYPALAVEERPIRFASRRHG